MSGGRILPHAVCISWLFWLAGVTFEGSWGNGEVVTVAVANQTAPLLVSQKNNRTVMPTPRTLARKQSLQNPEEFTSKQCALD